MAVYRNDPDLNLLGQCSNEELQLLISILTRDPRDGDTRWTEGLTCTPEYRLLAPDHHRYWQLIAAELQRYGANTLASLVRLGQGVTYREILVDVCDKLDVNYNQKSTSETIELALLMKVLEKSLDQMTPEELAAFSRNMHLDLTTPTPQLILIAVQAAIRTSSLAALELATMVSASVITSLGGIATWGTVVVASRTLSVLAGPLAIALSSAWMISDIAGPAYRVTIPACLIVSWLRQQHLSR
ncbi:oxidoreductase [Klebsiella michiganensis]|nr:oxidoreductase [Klebsiella michiganensis]